MIFGWQVELRGLQQLVQGHANILEDLKRRDAAAFLSQLDNIDPLDAATRRVELLAVDLHRIVREAQRRRSRPRDFR